MSAAINQVLDNELYGWTEVGNERIIGNHPHVRAWDGYGGIMVEGTTLVCRCVIGL